MGGFFAGWMAERYDWHWPFLFFGGGGILLGVVLLRHLIKSVRGAMDGCAVHESGRQTAQPMRFAEFARLAIQVPSIGLLMAAFACANFVAVVLVAWMPSFLYGSFHLNLAKSGLTATALAQTGSLTGTVIGG
jgi:MFS family permease